MNRPKDVNQRAKRIVDLSTGEVEPDPQEKAEKEALYRQSRLIDQAQKTA